MILRLVIISKFESLVFSCEKNIGNLIMRNFIAFYLGWSIAASNLNIGINFVHIFGASKDSQVYLFWILAPLCAIGATLFNYKKYGMHGLKSCFCLWLSVIWAFVGAAIHTGECLGDPTVSRCWQESWVELIYLIWFCEIQKFILISYQDNNHLKQQALQWAINNKPTHSAVWKTISSGRPCYALFFS